MKSASVLSARLPWTVVLLQLLLSVEFSGKCGVELHFHFFQGSSQHKPRSLCVQRVYLRREEPYSNEVLGAQSVQ